MESRITKWGNSLGIRIPRAMANEIAIDENTTVNLVVKNNDIVISKAKKYKLADLLSGITRNNRHAEISTGQPVGEEVW
jgi:antitoxin MazE